MLEKRLLIEILEDSAGLAAGSLSDTVKLIAQGSLQASFTARIVGVYRTAENQPWQYYDEEVSGNGLGPSFDIYKATPLEMQHAFFGDRSTAEEKARNFMESTR